MRLSYYGGGHYDSVSPIFDRTITVETTRGERLRAPGAMGIAHGRTPAPGELEEAALERSRRRKAETGSGRCTVSQIRSALFIQSRLGSGSKFPFNGGVLCSCIYPNRCWVELFPVVMVIENV